MVEIFLLSALIIAISMAFLCVKLIVLKDGRFTSQHIHDSKAMKRKGIGCVLEQDRDAQRNAGFAIAESERNEQDSKEIIKQQHTR